MTQTKPSNRMHQSTRSEFQTIKRAKRFNLGAPLDC
jgi:hypothetical protein